MAKERMPTLEDIRAWLPYPEQATPFGRWLEDFERTIKVETLEYAQVALAGEDTVEWSREATDSMMSYPLVMGVLDDLIEEARDE